MICQEWAWITPSVPPSLSRVSQFGGTWVAQSVERQTLAQVMITWFLSSSTMSGSVLTARSLEPTLDSLSPSLSLCPSPLKKQINIKKKECPSLDNKVHSHASWSGPNLHVLNPHLSAKAQLKHLQDLL